MKKMMLLILSLVFVQTAAFAETYTVTPENSQVKWTATKVMGKHYGTIRIASGTIHFEGDQFSGGEAAIDTTSLTVEDLEGESKEKLTGHLKNPDFFDVEAFPAAALKIIGVKPAGNNLYDVTADLTIKSVTHPVSFQAAVEKKDGKVQATAVFKVDRTLYGIRYGSGKFFENLGDRTIHDDFTLEVSVNAE